MRSTRGFYRGILFFCALGLQSCGQGDLPEYQKLDRLRLLSLKVSAPEARPGATVTLTPYISDVDGAGRTLDYIAVGCIDPGLERGNDPSCDSASDKRELAKGTITSANSPDFSNAARTGSAVAVSVSIPATILQGKSQFETLRGVDYIVLYELTASDGAKLKSLKRITASANPSPNANPALTAFQVNGLTAPSALPTEKFALTPAYSSNSSQTYLALRGDGTSSSFNESMQISWFTLGGEIEYRTTFGGEENSFTPDSEKHASGKTLLIGVARDGRGGEDVFKLEY